MAPTLPDALHPLAAWLLLAALGLTAWACNGTIPPDDYVARVEDAYLTQEALNAAMSALPIRDDSAGVRQQLIAQWVTNELLFQEARRRNLRAEEAVQQRLLEGERAILIDALVSQLYVEETGNASPSEMRSYYERNKEQLRLREPFVRVRYVSTTDSDSAETFRRLLQAATHDGLADSLWAGLVGRFAHDAEASLLLSSTYHPASKLFAFQPLLQATLARLDAAQITPILELEGRFHVLQLADRMPIGSIPELSWIEMEVRRQVAINARKQMYARQVQRLRNEALARDALDIR